MPESESLVTPEKADGPALSKAPTTDLYDVAVVGAGPAGSSIAASLAAHGWRVLLVERDEFPRHKVCGEFISPDAQIALRKLGLYSTVAALQPVPLTAAKVISRHGRKMHRPLPGVAWGLSRYAFDAALAAAAVERGAELRMATTVTRLQRDEPPMRNGFDDGIEDREIELHLHHRQESTTVRARTVIMAYGRVALPGISADQTPPSQNARTRYMGAKCHYAGVRMAKQVELYFFPGGYAGLNPVEGGHVNLCALASYAAFAEAGRSVSGILRAAIAANPALARKMANAEALVETECAVAPVDTYRRAQPWGDFAQLGDSAVMLPPLCGDGMAMALQSARLCAPLADAYLRGQISFATWEKLYRRTWSKEFRHRVKLGRRLQKMLQTPIVADGMLLTGALFPALADYFIASTRGKLKSEALSYGA
jgi:flavin-dependent dehydrogenase